MNKDKSSHRPGLFVNNIRFYVLVLSFLLSLLIASWLRLNIVSDRLFTIRLQQFYGFTAIAFWYLALIATPLSSVFGKEGIMKHYLFSRRALGVSGAYFALLHACIGIVSQLGGISSIFNLPDRFRVAILFGFIGLLILLAMAATSFDKIIKLMTFKRWKWLHRLTYIAITLVLLHLWLIGTHLDSIIYRIIILSFISLLAILESWRISLNIEKASGIKDSKMRLIIFIAMSLAIVGLSIYVPNTINRYHDQTHKGEHR